ncbi:MAG TPA: Arm DNA-binding domain-containing protein, partial [Acidimicrobiales bacterium]|nr:Arm DNA-binding domain-containing protein [Acidimicrobiales bacterium]
MPTKPEGVYQDGHGEWYVKVTIGRDPLTGRRAQLTRRGFRTAAEAGRARREMLDQVGRRQVRPAPRATTVNDLLDLYLDGLDADGRLAAKTRFDYRVAADEYVRPYLGSPSASRPRRARNLEPCR